MFAEGAKPISTFCRGAIDKSLGRSVIALRRYLLIKNIFMTKKIIMTAIILLAIGATAGAVNYDQALIDLWNRRPDLQKAFPNAPSDSEKLIAWAEKYGWKETPDLFNYYPDRQVINRLAEQKYEARVKALEGQINDLYSQMWQVQNRKPDTRTIETRTVVQQGMPEGQWVACCKIPNGGSFFCDKDMAAGKCQELYGSKAKEMFVFTKN